MMLTCEYCVKLKACSEKAIDKDYEKNPEYEGERFCPDFKKVLTNADYIRAMRDEEWAALSRFPCPYIKDEYDECKKPEQACEECILEWLKQPYKENEE